MGWPFAYTDIELQFVRLSDRESAYTSKIGYDPLFETTIGEPYDYSSFALPAPLSGGRIATCYYKEIIDEPQGAVIYGPISGWYAIDCVVTSGLNILGRRTIEMPASPLPYNPRPGPLTRNGAVAMDFTYGMNVAGAGDYVVIGAALFGDEQANPPTKPKWYGAEWLVLLDCSGNTPVVADTYFRAEFSDDLSSPAQLFPPTGSSEIRLVPMDDRRVVVVMLNPDYVGDDPESSLFSIKVSNAALDFQDNGYPTTTGSFDFGTSTFGQDFSLGYDDVSNVGMMHGDDTSGFGFSINAAGDNITFGTDTTSWSFEGNTYYNWGQQYNWVPSAEPGYFYGPVYPDVSTGTGNPVHTAKFYYSGSGPIQMVGVTSGLPHPDVDWYYYWANDTGSGWACAEHQGKVVLALPVTYYDGVEFLYDTFLVNDAFGEPEIYRVSNLSNVGGTNSDSAMSMTFVPVGGTLYMATNVPDSIQPSPVLYPDEPIGQPVLMTIVNFNQPNLTGEFEEKRRQFWRHTPY